MRQREDYLEGESLKYLALHYSTRNRDFNPGEIHRGPLTGAGWRQLHQRYVHGAYEMLNRSHLPLDLASDEHIVPGHLGQYGLLFLSNSACLSDAQCEAIAAYVDGGGTLIATCQTSLLDELGYDRGRFGLEKVLGVEYAGTREKTGEGRTEAGGRTDRPWCRRRNGSGRRWAISSACTAGKRRSAPAGKWRYLCTRCQPGRCESAGPLSPSAAL